MVQETQTRALYQPRGVEWGGRFKKECVYIHTHTHTHTYIYIYTYGLFILRFNKKHQNYPSIKNKLI